MCIMISDPTHHFFASVLVTGHCVCVCVCVTPRIDSKAIVVVPPCLSQ